MDTTQKNDAHTPPVAPEPPEDWECCGSECGDACIHEIYRREKAQYEADLKAWQAEQHVKQSS